MSFDWHAYHRLAVELHRIKNNTINEPEAFLRTAVSRAYYSAYHKALDFAEKNFGFIPQKNAKDQQNLISCYRTNKEFDVVNDLVTLRSNRTRCDYENTVPNLEKVTNSSITKSSILSKRFSRKK